ncbi:hypothetical protein [Aurantimonas coralicida]|uniref:hypothetical protein n=1 Tax=Aurantimonas coralicida TaxID=182270 RepID=UPI001E60738E|nr:hypothetical protein [Aurantimonas coralicida]MCD1643123.1 hypothetical protein [Aurantimonas coralicida]
MPTRLTLALSTALFALATLVAGDALALSQIDPVEGRSGSREGIIAVPLPPLTDAPVSETETGRPQGPGEGTDAGEVPLSPEDEVEPGDTRPAPAEGPERRREPRPAGEAPADATDRPGPGTPRQDGARARPDGATTNFQADRAPSAALASEVAYGDAGLPRPVRDLRARLMAVARSGEIEKLAPYIERGDHGTVLSFGQGGEDPIAFLKSASGDGEGIEILAILLEVLQSGYARMEPDTDNEIYVWPYFTQQPMDSLTKPQLVELFELVTAGDYKNMREFGAYNFYRVGISPEGRLEFFVAGD